MDEKTLTQEEITELEWDMERVQDALLNIYVELLLEQIAKDAREKKERQ